MAKAMRKALDRIDRIADEAERRFKMTKARARKRGKEK